MSEFSFSVNTSVGASTRILTARTSNSSAARIVPALDRHTVDPVQNVDHEVGADARLEQPVLGCPLDGEPGRLQRGGGLLGVGFGDDEVDVVHGFGPAEHPQRVAARQGEIRALRAQRRRRASERVAQVVVSCGHRSPDRALAITGMEYPCGWRPSTSCTDAASTTAPFIGTDWSTPIRQLDPDVLALQEVDLDQPRSGMADLTAVAAEAMGAVSHRFVAAISGTPGATWMAATGREQPGTAAYGIALLSRYPADSWQVLRLPRIPMRFPMYLPGPNRVQIVDEEPRAAMLARVDTPLGPMTVATTHLSFVPGWNRRQLRRLVRDLRGFSGPRVLMGDLNMSPPAVRRWSGLRPLAEALTFPADEPHRQLDHILTDADLRVDGCCGAGIADQRSSSACRGHFAALRP